MIPRSIASAFKKKTVIVESDTAEVTQFCTLHTHYIRVRESVCMQITLNRPFLAGLSCIFTVSSSDQVQTQEIY